MPRPSGSTSRLGGSKSRSGGSTTLPPIAKKKVPLADMCEYGDVRAVATALDDLEAQLGVVQFSATAARSTALHAAVRGGRLALVDMLLKRGFNPNLRDETGRTPLHSAVELVRHGNTVASFQLARFGREQIIGRLLESRADPNVVATATHESPLDAAARFNNEDSVNQLLAAGAVPTERTKASKPALGRRLAKTTRANRARRAREVKRESGAPSRLVSFFSEHHEAVKALVSLYDEEFQDTDGDGWQLNVVSQEGNFATLKLRLDGVCFYLSVQCKPFKVTNEFGMTIYEDE